MDNADIGELTSNVECPHTCSAFQKLRTQHQLQCTLTA
jgi:hypothetical protein